MAESTPPATDILKEGFLTKQGRRNATVGMVICELFVCIDLRMMRRDHIAHYDYYKDVL